MSTGIPQGAVAGPAQGAVPPAPARARKLLFELFAAEALRETQAGGAKSEAAELGLLRARALLALERIDAAYDAVGAVHARKDLGDRDREELRIVKARLLRRTSPFVDEALDLALRAASSAERMGKAAVDLAAEAHREAARLLAKKRVRDLADEHLKRAAALAPHDEDQPCAEAEVLCDFDERAPAIARYDAARALSPIGDRRGRAGRAHVAMLLGHFDEAHALLASLAPLRSGELYAQRLRARLFLAQQRWGDAIGAIDELLRMSPASDSAPRDKYDRACAFYRGGWIREACAAFEELGASAEQGTWVEYARRHAKMLARPDATQRPWRRLQAFPTVAQLRSHCGPASCELYLRYYGVPASQVEVARAIKFPDAGTPVYRMRSFLEQAGLHTRRIEADLPVLRRLVDAQIPVIVEEECSSSAHVAVAIGYDDVRDVLDVQDPMTHEVRETFYEELPKLRNLSNYGALVAVPRHDTQRIAALDHAGAVECRYISLVDEAWAAKHAGKLEEADRLVEQSLAIRRDYELAWFYKFGRAMDKVDAAPTPENRAAVQSIVQEILTLWPDDEWPEQLRGEMLATEGRFGEALQAFTRARDRDDADARNWASMGACQMALGQLDAAYESLKQALRRDPSHPSAGERLSLLALDRGEDELATSLNEVARKRAPDRPVNHYVHARLCQKRGRHAEAVEAFERALAIDAKKPTTQLERARSLARLGRVDEAAKKLEAACDELPKEPWLRVELARLLYENDRPEPAAKVAEGILASDPKSAAALAILGAAKARGPQAMEGMVTMRKALEQRPTDAWIYTQIGRCLSKSGQHAHAVEAFATALGLSKGEPERELELGVALHAAGHSPEAARLLARAASRGDLDEAALNQVGEVLVAAHEPVRPLFEEIRARRPDDLGVLRAFARTMLELCWAPEVARPILARILELSFDDPYAKAFRGANAFDAGLEREAEGEKLLSEAILAAPTIEYPRRVFAERLAQRGRHEEALAILAPCQLRHQVARSRVRSLLALERLPEIEATIAAFDKKWGEPGKTTYGARTLRYDVARRRGDYRTCLELAEGLSRDGGEDDADGLLDPWEIAKFECLARLGELERAEKFGLRQASNARSLGILAEVAHDAGQPTLAQAFADRVLRIAPRHSSGLFISARTLELRGDVAGAMRMYQETAAVDPSWHKPHTFAARLALATGDAALALQAAEAGVRAAHASVEAFGARAAARLASGDRSRAGDDLERAWKMARPEAREREMLDLWSLRAQVHGDLRAADALLAAYLASPQISPADRARAERLRAIG